MDFSPISRKLVQLPLAPKGTRSVGDLIVSPALWVGCSSPKPQAIGDAEAGSVSAQKAQQEQFPKDRCLFESISMIYMVDGVLNLVTLGELIW